MQGQQRVKKQVKTSVDDLVHIFSRKDAGVDVVRLQNLYQSLLPSIAWDYYDVRRKQIQLITTFLDTLRKGKIIDNYFTHFYTGQINLDSLLKLLNISDADMIKRLKQIQPWRKISHASLSIFGLENKTVRVDIHEHEPYKIKRGLNTIYASPHLFPKIPNSIIEGAECNNLFEYLFRYVSEKEDIPFYVEADMFCMSVYSADSTSSSNAPEGFHQDGGDYSLTAFVLSRENLEGGQSVASNKPRNVSPEELSAEHEVSRYTLGEGEGMVVSEQAVYPEFDMFHTVTPIKAIDMTKPAVRSIIGMDMHVRRV